MSLYRQLGYIKIDAEARRHRHEFWRETIRHAAYRRIIGTCIGIALTVFMVWVLLVEVGVLQNPVTP